MPVKFRLYGHPRAAPKQRIGASSAYKAAPKPSRLMRSEQRLLERLGLANPNLTAAGTVKNPRGGVKGTLNPRNMIGAQPVTGGTKKDTLQQLWIDAGGPSDQANIAAAVALAESSGNQYATNHNTNGTDDNGLWQINSIHGFDPQKLRDDPMYNAQAAVSVYESSGWGAWTTYKTGAYQRYLRDTGSQTYQASGSSGYGGIRPGGEPAGQGSGGSVSDVFQRYEAEIDLPRTAPPSEFTNGPTGPFKWWLASFTNQWNQEHHGP